MSTSKFITSLVLLSSYNLFTSTFATLNAANNTRLALRLLHRDSLSRFHIQEKLTNSVPLDDIRGDLVPYRDNLLLVNVSIGQPPIPQLLILDTGSSLIWTCTSCPLGVSNVFNPSSSSSYIPRSCNYDDSCRAIYDNSHCRRRSQCEYRIEYGEGSSSRGFLASETFTFATSTGGTVELPNLAFGVAFDNRGMISEDSVNGVLGLQALDSDSLVARVGRHFSYCIGNISNPDYKYNQLVLGDGAIIQGDPTPVRTSGGRYHLKIEGISVGDKQLEINEDDFDFNVIIDSGSTYSYLRPSGYEPLKREVQRLIDGLLQPVQIPAEDVCYKGNLVRDLKGFPIVTLHLADGADLYLDAESLFTRKSGDTFCMAVDVPKNSDDDNLIGLLAQQSYNVGFDLNEETISFQRIDCELLED